MKWLKSLLRKISFFPRVTSNKKEFLQHIIITCKTRNIDEELKNAWVEHVRDYVVEACYFWNMVYLPNKKISTILHEYLHHIIEHIRIGTKCDQWSIVHYLNDDIYVLICWRDKE